MRFLSTILFSILFAFNAFAQIDLELDISDTPNNNKLEFNKNNNEQKDNTDNTSILDNALSIFKKGSSSSNIPTAPIDDLLKRADAGDAVLFVRRI